MTTLAFRGIILASESPRRKKLLFKMGVTFDVIPSQIMETPPMDETPGSYAARLALEKATKVGMENPEHLVIGADTVVALEGEIMGKPGTTEEAHSMLNRLSGNWHDVWTGVCLYNQQYLLEMVRAVRTAVRFKDLSEKEVVEYVETGEPMDKAGAYAIQGRGNVLVREIKGSYENVVGLPTLELGRMLQELGLFRDNEILGK